MVDSTHSFESAVRTAADALANGDAGSVERAEALYRDALDVGNRALGENDLSLVAALTGLGAALLPQGRHDEAAAPLARAIAVGEQHLGGDHPDFVTLLNDVARLYLRHAAHLQAEPLLERLYEIKRQKGEQHPEVATVLASLASVRQKLGRHDDAEQLWRRVVEIRELTLAPNHIAIAAALEHLGQTCAARAKLPEALGHLQRALAMRAATLGPDHPSLQPARDRISDLQLQAADELLDAGDTVTAPSAWPSRPRLLPIPEVATPPRASAPARERETEFLSGADSRGKVLVPVAGSLVVSSHVQQTPVVPYMDVLMDIRSELDETEPHEPPGRAAAFASTVATLFRQRRRAAIVTAAVVAVPLVALGVAGSMRGADRTPRWVERGSFAAALPPLDTTTSTTSQLAIPSALGALYPQRDSAISVASTGPARSRGIDVTASGPRVERSDPVIPIGPVSMRRLDSLARAISVPSQAVADAFDVQLQSNLANMQQASLAELQPRTAGTRAKLIGGAPAPRYPNQLSERDIGGEVRVRFDVDTLGRPVMSTFSVLASPHPLLSESVRRIVPSMRFEPARTPGPVPRTITESVEMSFQFAPRGT